MEPKARTKASASRGGLCQHRIITKDVRQVVTIITVITAKPAFALTFVKYGKEKYKSS